MTKYLIEGGHPLHGTIEISGAKNAAVAIIPAALLVDGVCRIENVPQISDVTLILQILRELGADVRTINRTTVEIDCSHIRNRQVPYELARKIRASYYLVGALLGRFGWAEVPLPGGCNLGGRPIDQHIKGFEAMGASVEGEIGHVAMGDENAITTVEDAVAFHKATGVDALAVSIGTVHGFYKAEPKIEAGRCAEIAEALPGVPLVLHGGTGTPPADLRKVIENGISKINIATEFMDTFLKSTRRELDKLGGGFAPIDKFMDPVIDDCAAHAARLLKFFAGK